jgi:high-affinity iron transporter
VGATFLITAREGFEAALLLGLVYASLDRIGRRDQFGQVTTGAWLGVMASALMGMAVTMLSGPLLDLGPDLIAATVIFAAVGLLTWHGWWMRQHARALRGEVEQRVEDAEASHRLWAVGLIAFAGVFREGAETVLFLWGLMTQVGSAQGWDSAMGAVLGLAVAAALGWGVYHGGARLSLPRFFTATSVLILFLAAGLFSTGLGRLQALGALPPADVLWDTSAVLSNESVLGSFLNGLVGYRARPSTIEAFGYLAYVIVGTGLFFGSGALTPWRRVPVAASPDERTRTTF